MELKKCRNTIIFDAVALIISVLCFLYFKKINDLVVTGFLVIAITDFCVLIKDIFRYRKLKKTQNQ